MSCDRCGFEHVTPRGHPSCVAHKKSGIACRANPIRGGTVCSKHGGMAPQIRRRAREREVVRSTGQKVGELLAAVDMPTMHPIDGLLDVVTRSAAMTRVLGELVGGLRTNQGGIYRERATGGDSHPLVSMYEKWARLHAQACKTALDAHIDELVVRNASSTADIMWGAVSRAIRDLGMPPSEAERFGVLLAGELRRAVGVIPAAALPAASSGRGALEPLEP